MGEYEDEIEKMSKSGREMGQFIPFAGVCPEGIPETGAEHTFETGVIVLATGFKPYTPRKGEYGYGEFEEIITLPDLIRIIAENREKGGGDALKINGRKIRNIV